MLELRVVECRICMAGGGGFGLGGERFLRGRFGNRRNRLARDDHATTTRNQALSRQADADRLDELSVRRCGGANARSSTGRSRVYELWQRFRRPAQHHPR